VATFDVTSQGVRVLEAFGTSYDELVALPDVPLLH
jgi:hypothetical protein